MIAHPAGERSGPSKVRSQLTAGRVWAAHGPKLGSAASTGARRAHQGSAVSAASSGLGYATQGQLAASLCDQGTTHGPGAARARVRGKLRPWSAPRGARPGGVGGKPTAHRACASVQEGGLVQTMGRPNAFARPSLANASAPVIARYPSNSPCPTCGPNSRRSRERWAPRVSPWLP